jgi:hypothetical protein
VQKAGYIPMAARRRKRRFFRQQVEAAGEAVKAAGIAPN